MLSHHNSVSVTRVARESLGAGQPLPGVRCEGRGWSCSIPQLESVQNTMIIFLLCEESFPANNLYSLRLCAPSSNHVTWPRFR